MIDPENAVMKLCQEGMGAEAQGRLDDARQLFEQAWEARQNDFEACVAAHYVARHQETPQDTLYWNQQALTYAQAVNQEAVRGFYASLYLNLGWSYEQLGELAQAKAQYALAEAHLADVPDSAYREVVQGGIQNAHKRMATGDGDDGV